MDSARIVYLRPSKADTWGKCAGYARLMSIVKAPLDDGDNDVCEDGTATHELVKNMWDSACVIPWPNVGSMSSNGREITEELIAGAEEHLDFIRTWGEGQDDCYTHVEQGIPTGSIFIGATDGTPDAWWVSPRSTRGKLADLKMGFAVVEVWRNPQLIVYAWTLFCLFPHLVDMEVTIVQPRAAHHDGTIRTWLVTREEMRPLADALQQAALNAHALDPQCTVSPSCRNCGAAHACRTLQVAGGVGVDISYGSTPHELTPEQLGYELLKLQQAHKHMEHRINGLSAQAESLIKRGSRVPGYSLERRATRNRWKEDRLSEVEQLGRLFGAQVEAPKKLRTPAQLRGEFPGLDIEALYAERPTGENVLKATDPNEAIRAFTQRKLK